jgi:hypothetical protein
MTRTGFPAVVVVALLAAVTGCGHSASSSARMVTVPLVTQTDVTGAYDLLRATGLRVAIRNAYSIESLCVPIAHDQLPPSGKRVAAGSVVTFSADGCERASPTVPLHMRATIVPDFLGRRASDVTAWADRARIFWDARDLPALAPSAERQLLDNYTVVRQRPAPGTSLTAGVGSVRSFRLTPITVRAKSR